MLCCSDVKRVLLFDNFVRNSDMVNIIAVASPRIPNFTANLLKLREMSESFVS